MKRTIQNIQSDIAPLEGRRALADWQGNSTAPGFTWEETDFAIEAELAPFSRNKEWLVRVAGSIHARADLNPAPGWIDIEIANREKPFVRDIYLVGTRPLPQTGITCFCRHPLNKDCLLAATGDLQMLVLDARLPANLRILFRENLPASLSSLVCLGKRLLGLEKKQGRVLFCIELDGNDNSGACIKRISRILLPVSLTALAENDCDSAWGLTKDGTVYNLNISRLPLAGGGDLVTGGGMIKRCSFERRPYNMSTLSAQIKSLYRSIKMRAPSSRQHYIKEGAFAGLAFDGTCFWTFRRPALRKATGMLLLYSCDGTLLNSFAIPPEASLTAINYCHNILMVLDEKHGLFHQYLPDDAMQPVASMSPHPTAHPGYLSAGKAATAGIHNLCLLYTGGVGTSSVHQYDVQKLMPLAGYMTVHGIVKDFFMDGFLLLAQYSPLLNGRSFAVDLPGPPSRQEDWLALFDEYFNVEANLSALEECSRMISRKLPGKRPATVKVVLGIPTPDHRCLDWDGKGFSLATASRRVETTSWAMKELIDRWGRARFRHLALAGFYYMTEQGSWNDPVMQAFPRQCRCYGLKSFAIPGIYSSWMTEFTRAGFDCVAFQSSHAFSRSDGRPGCYLLKNSGRIAREFGMGMEMELPYDVLEAAGRQKVRDYIDMAYIQGWSGAFKAYFQSYNLIKSLADSSDPESRALYDELYKLSRLSKDQQVNPGDLLPRKIMQINGQGKFTSDAGRLFLRLNIEGHKGMFKMQELSAN